MANTRDPDAEVMFRVELGYCPRCGSLRVFAAGAAEELCESCERLAAWVRTGFKRPPRRSPRRARATQGEKS